MSSEKINNSLVNCKYVLLKVKEKVLENPLKKAAQTTWADTIRTVTIYNERERCRMFTVFL